MTWPPGWVEVFCNDCHHLVGAYDTTCPQLVMGFYCTCSSNVTWIEPAVRKLAIND